MFHRAEKRNPPLLLAIENQTKAGFCFPLEFSVFGVLIRDCVDFFYIEGQLHTVHRSLLMFSAFLSHEEKMLKNFEFLSTRCLGFCAVCTTVTLPDNPVPPIDYR